MGAAGKYRKGPSRGQERRLLAEAETAHAVLVGEGPFGDGSPHEAWLIDTALGRVVFVVPAICEADHPKVRSSIAARREPSIRGRCPACGARPRLRDGGLHFWHENDCVAGDERLHELIVRHSGGAT